jgi:hypothetical protein
MSCLIQSGSGTSESAIKKQVIKSNGLNELLQGGQAGITRSPAAGEEILQIQKIIRIYLCSSVVLLFFTTDWKFAVQHIESL